MKTRKMVFGGHVVKAFETTKLDDGTGREVPVGIVEGYLATWDIDRANDRIAKGAFAETIADFIARGRNLRLKRNHWNLIGMFDPEKLVEDDTGLFGTAEINLLVQEGHEAYALAKQGALSDFSVAFSADPSRVDMEDGVRIFRAVTLWETSLVDEPMNPGAVATSVRGAVPVGNLPTRIASRDTAWDSTGAIERIRTETGSDEEPSDTYRSAFLYFEDGMEEDFTAYKLPVCDVVDGDLAVIPRAVFAARAALEGARGGVDMPEDERPKVEATINALYERMDMDPPFEMGSTNEERTWSAEEVRGLPISDQRYIIRGKRLSRGAIDEVITALSGSGGEKGGEKAGDADEVVKMIADHVTTEDQKAVRELIEILQGV